MKTLNFFLVAWISFVLFLDRHCGPSFLMKLAVDCICSRFEFLHGSNFDYVFGSYIRKRISKFILRISWFRVLICSIIALLGFELDYACNLLTMSSWKLMVNVNCGFFVPFIPLLLLNYSVSSSVLVVFFEMGWLNALKLSSLSGDRCPLLWIFFQGASRPSI